MDKKINVLGATLCGFVLVFEIASLMNNDITFVRILAIAAFGMAFIRHVYLYYDIDTPLRYDIISLIFLTSWLLLFFYSFI